MEASLLGGALPVDDPARARPIVELAGVSRTFGEDPPVHALREVDLAICAGRVAVDRRPLGLGQVDPAEHPRSARPATAGTYLFEGIDVDGPRRPRTGPGSAGAGSASSSSRSISCRSARARRTWCSRSSTGGAPRRVERTGAGRARAGRARDRPSSSPTKLSGGRATAGRDRPGARRRTQHAPLRRAHRQPRLVTASTLLDASEARPRRPRRSW